MRRSIAPMALAALSALLASCTGSGHDETLGVVGSPQTGVAIVESVTDGDTIRVRPDRRVRLVQIDTPEVGDHAQCWGAEASAALKDRLHPGARVVLEADPELDDVDQHGRELRYVSLDGELLNAWLVREGHALPYFFRGARGAHATELLDAARSARAARRGMWGACRDVHIATGIGI
jgi:micrococcal nuclease